MPTCSPVQAFGRFAAHRFRTAIAGVESEPLPGRPSVTASRLTASAAALDRYLRATGGWKPAGWEVERVGRREAGRGDDDSSLLPPVYPCVWETGLFIDLLRIGGYPFPRRGIVHLGGERIYLRAALSTDEMTLRLELERAERVRRGLALHLRSELTGPSGQLLTTGSTEMLLPGDESREPSGGKGSVRASDEAGEEGVEWHELARWRLGENAGRRYAAASGDFNPIHLFRLTARPFGFRRPVLHGYCVEAMVAHAVIANELGGDPAGLRRMTIRFLKPLLLPADVLLLTARSRTTAASRFRVVHTDGRRKAFAEGDFLAAKVKPDQGKRSSIDQGSSSDPRV